MSDEPVFPIIRGRKTPVLDLLRQGPKKPIETFADVDPVDINIREISKSLTIGLSDGLGISRSLIPIENMENLVRTLIASASEPNYIPQVESLARSLGDTLTSFFFPPSSSTAEKRVKIQENKSDIALG